MFRTGLASSFGAQGDRPLHVADRQWRRLFSNGVGTFAIAANVWVGLAASLIAPVPVHARETPSEIGPKATVALTNLPPQAQETYRLILSGGPFPYKKDGVVFGNRERQLPRKNRGYYHEYTVKTPRSRDRGARRIVCGGEPKTQPEVCYYTADHYATFSRIAP